MIKIALPCGRTMTMDESDLEKIRGYRLHAEARGNTHYIRMRNGVWARLNFPDGERQA